MVAVDSTASPVEVKRKGKGAAHRTKIRNRVRSQSTRLVMTGRVELTPCVACGTTRNLTIHHVEPLQVDRFVFLCEECHVLAHKPVFQTIKVCVAPGHFSIVPSAIASRVDIPREVPPAAGAAPPAPPESGPQQSAVDAPARAPGPPPDGPSSEPAAAARSFVAA